MESPLAVPSLVLAAALAASAAAFVAMRRRLGRALPAPFAAPRGSADAGVRWALTAAFLPWNKESARDHPASYGAGLVLHAGVAVMLARLLWTLTGRGLPRSIATGAAIVIGAGLVCGLGLFAKRALDPRMRALSIPEDYVASAFVGATLALGLAACLSPRAVIPFQWAGAALALYAPLGKLRHMVFLVTSRRFWGRFFGRRGVKPAPGAVAGGGTRHG